MIYNRLTVCNELEQKEVQRIYETSFPIDERREFDSLLHLAQQNGAYKPEVVCKNGTVVGFISSWNFDEWRYIEHFAVDAALRGCGIGREVLRNFVERDARPVVLEVEPPIDKMSCRRVEFYTRQGFVLHNSYQYIQPPYDSNRNAVELRLMTYGAPVDCNLDALTALLHSRVYGRSDKSMF